MVTSKLNYLPAFEVVINQSLDKAIRAALQKWQFETGHTLRYWRQGYCASFALVLAEFMGKSARLGSVLASDGNVHHIVVVLGSLVIDARGVNTEQSLLSEINREADTHSYSLKAVRIIPFKLEHARFLKECPEKQIGKLKACFNVRVIHRICRRFKAFVPGCSQAQQKDKSARFSRGES